MVVSLFLGTALRSRLRLWARHRHVQARGDDRPRPHGGPRSPPRSGPTRCTTSRSTVSTRRSARAARTTATHASAASTPWPAPSRPTATSPSSPRSRSSAPEPGSRWSRSWRSTATRGCTVTSGRLTAACDPAPRSPLRPPARSPNEQVGALMGLMSCSSSLRWRRMATARISSSYRAAPGVMGSTGNMSGCANPPWRPLGVAVMLIGSPAGKACRRRPGCGRGISRCPQPRTSPTRLLRSDAHSRP